MTPADKPKVDASEVGWLFVQEYYTTLNRDPGNLHCFYNKKSAFLHGTEGETAKHCYGQTEIHTKILALGFDSCKVLVSNVDSQSSASGGIIVQVLGELSNKGSVSHKFAQTFFLAEQPNGYYVLNDIFRFLKEDLEDEYADEYVESVSAPAAAVNGHYSPEHGTIVAPVVPTPAPVPAQQQKQQQQATPKKQPVDVPRPVSPVQQPAVEPAAPKAAPQAAKAPAPETKKTEAPKPLATPAPSPEKPVVAQAAAAPEPSPAKPKSWAIAAGTSSGAPPVVGAGVASKPVAPKTSPAKKPSREELSKPEQSASANSASNGFRKEDREKSSVYVRGITDVHDRKSVAEAFSAFGPVLKVDLIHAKGIAFVDFSSADGALKAVGASLTVGGATLLIEERKRGGGSGGNKNGNNGNNGKSSGAQRSGSAPRQRGPPKPKQDKQPAPAR